MVVATENLVVEVSGIEHALSVISFVDRRKKPHRRKAWVLIRGIERLLFGVNEGCRSTGAFAAHLIKCSLDGGNLVCERARVDDGTITNDELQAVFAAIRPLVDPESRNRIRKASVLPISTLCPALVEFGRCDATQQLLIALNKAQTFPCHLSMTSP